MNNEKKLEEETAYSKKTGSRQISLTFKLNREMLTLVVLIALVVVSGVQTIKLSGLKANSAGAVVAPNSSDSADSNSGSSLPASLQNLPSQVGGC